jgi:hypothetical protein
MSKPEGITVTGNIHNVKTVEMRAYPVSDFFCVKVRADADNEAKPVYSGTETTYMVNDLNTLANFVTEFRKCADQIEEILGKKDGGQITLKHMVERLLKLGLDLPECSVEAYAVGNATADLDRARIMIEERLKNEE